MSGDVKVRIVITMDLLPPTSEEDLESYLDYCQTHVFHELESEFRSALIRAIELRGSFTDETESLDKLEGEEVLALLMAYEI